MSQISTGGPTDPDQKFSRPEAAQYLGIGTRTLEGWAVRGGGPRMLKLGSRVVYRRRDLDDWLANRERANTSDRGNGRMSRPARDLARRLTSAGIDPSVLVASVNDMASARAEAINREGLQAQISYLLEAYGPSEIESLALANRRQEERP
jgi:predicted DNA-binding transcriptional regulator AlpA